MNELTSKPPLGVKPRRIWLEDRIDELVRALYEYRNQECKKRNEWLGELQHVIRERMNIPWQVQYSNERTND